MSHISKSLQFDRFLRKTAHVTKLRIKLSVQKRSHRLAIWAIEGRRDCPYGAAFDRHDQCIAQAGRERHEVNPFQICRSECAILISFLLRFVSLWKLRGT